MELVLIRHGESLANAIKEDKDKIFIGQWDCDLTERGRHQAAALKGSPLLKNTDAVYCSDLKRAVDTAALLSDIKPVIDKRLRERSLGDFEGRLVNEIEANPLYEKYFTNPEYTDFRHGFSAKAPGGENYTDVCKRVSSFLNELDENFNKVIIVSHFCAIRCIIKTVKSLSEEETLKLKIYNCDPIILNV